MINIADNLNSIESKINEYAKNCQRNPNDIQLLAVSKTKSIDLIEQAYHAGQRCFGESYAQEIDDKAKQLAQLTDIEWHFIGPIQSNKTKLIANNVSWVHSIDREKIAQRLNEQRDAGRGALNVLIQVNISGEQSKSGVTPEKVFQLAKFIGSCQHLKLRGLMAIPEKAVENVDTSPNFIKMAKLFKQLQLDYPEIDTLSMGMSADLRPAIDAGSTLVRIGSAIFGARE
jgi:pyridoxal phosphate enzyme (YggS family)